MSKEAEEWLKERDQFNIIFLKNTAPHPTLAKMMEAYAKHYHKLEMKKEQSKSKTNS